MNQIFRYLLDLVVDTEYAKKLVKEWVMKSRPV